MRRPGCALIPALLGLSLLVQAEPVQLNSLEWPPYSGSLSGQGFLSSLLREALARENYQLTVKIYPWKRATGLAMQGEEGALGFFSASPIECAAARGQLSDPIGYYQLTLAQRSDALTIWREASEFHGKRIGVVEGYDNGKQIDALIYAGKVQADYSSSDVQNLNKLAAGRLAAAVVDKRVFSYYQHKLGLDQLLVGPANLTRRLPLHVCFNQSPSAERLRQALNRQLSGLDLEQYAERYLAHLAKAGKPSSATPKPDTAGLAK